MLRIFQFHWTRSTCFDLSFSDIMFLGASHCFDRMARYLVHYSDYLSLATISTRGSLTGAFLLVDLPFRGLLMNLLCRCLPVDFAQSQLPTLYLLPFKNDCMTTYLLTSLMYTCLLTDLFYMCLPTSRLYTKTR